jgi:hypothetical protein
VRPWRRRLRTLSNGGNTSGIVPPPPPPAPTATAGSETTFTIIGSTHWDDGGSVSGTFYKDATVIGTVTNALSQTRVLDINGAESWGVEWCLSFTSNDVIQRFDYAGQLVFVGLQQSPFTLIAYGIYITSPLDCNLGHAIYGHAQYHWQNANPALNVVQDAARNCTALVPATDLPVGLCDPIISK